jgi:hypothetical protein
MTVSGGAPFKRSKFSLALGIIKRGATYCPAAWQQISAVVERGTTNSFLPFQFNYFGQFVGIC